MNCVLGAAKRKFRRLCDDDENRETYELLHQMVIIERFEYYEGKAEEYIGRGTFSDLYKGYDSGNNGRTVAVRKFHRTTVANRELALLPTLDQDNLVRVLSVQERGMFMFVIGEYFELTLKQHLFRNGPFPQEAMQLVTRQLANAVSFLVARHISHRNIKPSNIFVKPRLSGGFTLKLSDFGLSNILDQHYAQRCALGSFHYMSPEMGAAVLLRKRVIVDDRTDIWSLGLVFYKCAVGALPFNEEQLLMLFISAANHEPTSEKHAVHLTAMLPLELLDLLHQMLCFNYRRRIKASELSRHPFLSSIDCEHTPSPEPMKFVPKKPFCAIV